MNARRIAILLASGPLMQAGWLGVTAIPDGRGQRIEAIDMLEDGNGVFWVAAKTGLFRHEGENSWRKLDIHAGFPFPGAQHLGQTSDGSIWIASTEGLVRFNNNVFHTESRAEVRSLTVSGKWVLTATPTGIERMAPGERRRISDERANGLLVADREGKIWFGCGTQVCSLVVETGALNKFPVPGVPTAKWIAAARDPDGTLWIASRTEFAAVREGLIRQRWGRRSPQTERPIAADEAGHVWFLDDHEIWRGFGRGSGRYNLRDKEAEAFRPVSRDRVITSNLDGFTVHRHYDGINVWTANEHFGGPGISGLTGYEDRVFVGTPRGIFYQSQGSEVWRRLPTTPDVRDIRNLYIDRDGTIWVLERKAGLVVFTPSGKERARLRLNSALLPEAFREVIRDGTGRVWLASKAGLFLITESGTYLTAQPFPLPNQSFYAAQLGLDQGGRLWCAYEGGVARLDEDNWAILPIANQLTVPYVRSVTLPPGDQLLIGYRRTVGLSLFEQVGGGWRHRKLSETQGFFSDDVHFVRRDHQGRTWLGNPLGFAMAPHAGAYARDWTILDDRTTAFSATAEERGFWEDPKGNIWLGARAGLFRLDAEYDPSASSASMPIVGAVRAGSRLLLDAASALRGSFGQRHLVLEVRRPVVGAWNRQPIEYSLSAGGAREQWRPLKGDELYLDLAGGATNNLAIRFTGPRYKDAVRRHSFQVEPSFTESVAFRTAVVLSAMIATFWALVTHRVSRVGSYVTYWISKGLFQARRRFRVAKTPLAEVSTGWPTECAEVGAGRYRLGERLGEGGYSRVYRAFDRTDPEARLALKAIPFRPERSHRQRHRFAHEIAAMHSLKLRGSMPVLDSWIEDDGTAFILMPLIEGPTLREWAAALPEPGSERRLHLVYPVIARLAETLAAIHAAGFIHRDLKPANILMAASPEGGLEPVVADFGSAAARGAGDLVDVTLEPAGSLAYMAPEQVRGQFNASTDLYSFGLIVFELLSGVPYWEAMGPGSRPNPGEWLRARYPEVPAELGDLLDSVIHMEPESRPADTRAWLNRMTRNANAAA